MGRKVYALREEPNVRAPELKRLDEEFLKRERQVRLKYNLFE